MTTAIAIRNNQITLAEELAVAKKYRLPNIANITSLKIYGGDRARTERNFLTGLAVDGVVGSPAYGDYFTTFSEANYLQTSIADTADFTVLSAVKVPALVTGNRHILLTNFGSLGTNYPAGSSGSTMGGRGQEISAASTSVATTPWERSRIDGSTVNGNTNAGTGVGAVNLAAADVGSVQCLVGRSRASDRVVRNDNKTKNAGSSGTLASDIATAGPWTVGGSPLAGATTGAAIDIYAQIFAARYLTDQEVADLHGWLQLLYAGIVTF